MREQLYRWLKDNGITQEQAARKVGYTLNYLNSVLTGRSELTDAVIWRFLTVYPETASFLLPSGVVESLKANGLQAEEAPA